MRSRKIFSLITDLIYLSKIEFKRANSFDKQFFSGKIVKTLSFIQLNLVRFAHPDTSGEYWIIEIMDLKVFYPKKMILSALITNIP